MDYPLLIYALLVFLVASAIGHREYLRLVNSVPNFSIREFHKHPGWVRIALLLLLILMVPAFFLIAHRPSMWYMPDWLDLSLLWWTNGLGSILFGLLYGLARSGNRRESIQNGRALVMTCLLCQFGVLFSTGFNERLVATQLSDEKWSGKMLKQTSGFSCAPASAANVAGVLGLSYSEKQMAEFMSTRVSGTSPAFVIRGLRKAGIMGTRLELLSRNPDDLPLPAILIVNHITAGPESHAVAALKYDPLKKLLHVWDPYAGKMEWTQDDLTRIWPGHAIVCKRIESK